MRFRERGIGNLGFILTIVLLLIALASFFIQKTDNDKLVKEKENALALVDSNKQLILDFQDAYDTLVQKSGFTELARDGDNLPEKEAIQKAVEDFIDAQNKASQAAGTFEENPGAFTLKEDEKVIVRTVGDKKKWELYRPRVAKETGTLKALAGDYDDSLKMASKISQRLVAEFNSQKSQFDGRISNLQGAADQASTAYASDAQAKQQVIDNEKSQKTDLQDRLSDTTEQKNQAVDKLKTETRKFEKEKITMMLRINALETALTNMKEQKDIAQAQDPEDGKVLAVSRRNTVWVDLGRRDRANAGLKLKVWQLGQGSRRQDVALIRLIRVDGTKAEGRIIERYGNAPVAKGMSVSNPFYSKTERLRAYIFGNLVKYNTDVARRRLRRAGIDLANAPDRTTDIIILGEPEVKLSEEEEEAAEDEEGGGSDTAKNVERNRRIDYILEKARSIGAIVVTEKVLATFIDY